MGAFICRQPNGLLCRFSTVVDCVTNWDMTEEDYIENCVANAKINALAELAYDIKPFEQVVDQTLFRNTTRKAFRNWLREVGYKE